MIPEPKLKSLYQEVILDHNKNPRNFKNIENPSCFSQGHNPLCGDSYKLYLLTDKKGQITDVGFEGSGCAISKASASMMTTLIKEKTTKEALELQRNFVKFLTEEDISEETVKKLKRLRMFEGVKEFPIRVKCATLIWHALEDALKDLKGA